MKKFLVIVLVVVLLVTGGVFAYTYTTATTTLAVNAIESDFATISTENITAPTAPTVFGKFTGIWPTGTLFAITPIANYTGDLVIKVYMVNAGQLIRYYHHCNMALEFQDSTGTMVDDQKIFQLLNLQNAEAQFYWTNATGDSPYKVQLTGGSFRLHHWKSGLTGGSVIPQIWCEVTQR